MAVELDMDAIMENPASDVLEAMLEKIENETPDDPVEDEVETAQSAGAKEDQEEQQEAEAQAEEPEGIATKSGKGVIPYTVLATERERRHAAENALKDMQSRLEAMESQAKTGQATSTEAQPEQSGEELEQLFSDYPQLAKPFKALQAQLAQAETRLSQIQEVESARAVEAQSQLNRAVSEAMDDHPALLFWEKSDPEKFEQAVAFDQQLKTNPTFAAVALTDRFAKVVEMMETLYGKTELPPEYQTKKPEAPAKKEDAAEAKKRAEAAAAKALEGGKPRTLSDLPGGVPPVSDDTKLENMSVSELESLMDGKSIDQIQALVARFS